MKKIYCTIPEFQLWKCFDLCKFLDNLDVYYDFDIIRNDSKFYYVSLLIDCDSIAFDETYKIDDYLYDHQLEIKYKI